MPDGIANESLKTARASQPESTSHIHFLTWLIFIGAMSFAFYVAYDQKLFHRMVAVDQSYLSSSILIVFFAATVHAGWHIVATSWKIKAASGCLNGEEPISEGDLEPVRDSKRLTPLGDNPEIYISGFILELKDRFAVAKNAEGSAAAGGDGHDDHTLEIYADRLRAQVETGWYIVDVLIRLGLIGTIIGFILILSNLVDGPLPTSDEIQKVLVRMSGGMGTALYTTLAGLVTATLLGVQYMILGRSVEELIANLIRIKEKTGLG